MSTFADYTDEANIVRLRAKGGGGGSQPQPFAFVTLTVVDPYASGDPIPFDTVGADAHGFWDADNHQFVIPAGLGGVYHMGLQIDAADGGTGHLSPASGEISGSFTGPYNLFGGATETTSSHDLVVNMSGVGIAHDAETVVASFWWAGVAASAELTNCIFYLMRLGDAP